MTSATSAGARLAAVRARIDAAARAAGRDPAGVRLLAVSKTFPPADVRALAALGQVDFGENRAQELLAKAPQIEGRPTWHFIGRLQRNKVAGLAPLVDLWQSVDRIELGQDIFPRDQQTPAALRALHQADIEKWWPIVKAAAAKMD